MIHFWSLNSATPAKFTPESLLKAQAEICHSLLHLVQALTAESFSVLPQLYLITRGAHAVEHTDKVAVTQGPVNGLAAVIANEFPKFRCRTIDLAPNETADETRLLFSELFADDGEDQVALRGAARYASRVARTSADLHARRGSPDGRQKPYRVEIESAGALDNLVLREHAIRRPGPDEVVIEIKAAALNFRDVMKALGIYPGDNDDDALVGDECSG